MAKVAHHGWVTFNLSQSHFYTKLGQRRVRQSPRAHRLRIFATNGTRIADESGRLAAAQQTYVGWALFGMKFSRDSLLDRKGSFTTAPLRLLRVTKAGAFYAIIAFVIGFILGTIRVLLLVPRLGETTAASLKRPSCLLRVGSSAAGAWIGSM